MAQIRADEISRLLREEIDNYERVVNVSETGSVISVGDGIARLYGLKSWGKEFFFLNKIFS